MVIVNHDGNAMHVFCCSHRSPRGIPNACKWLMFVQRKRYLPRFRCFCPQPCPAQLQRHRCFSFCEVLHICGDTQTIMTQIAASLSVAHSLPFLFHWCFPILTLKMAQTRTALQIYNWAAYPTVPIPKYPLTVHRLPTSFSVAFPITMIRTSNEHLQTTRSHTINVHPHPQPQHPHTHTQIYLSLILVFFGKPNKNPAMVPLNFAPLDWVLEFAFGLDSFGLTKPLEWDPPF